MQQVLVNIARKRPEIGAVLVAIALSLLFIVLSSGTWSAPGSMQVILRFTAVLGVIAIGQALVIMSGEIDISVGSVFGFCALVFLGISPHVGVPLAIVITLLTGAAIGFVNGFFIVKGRIPALIVTLGTLFIFRGLAFMLTRGFHFAAPRPVKADPFFQVFGGGYVGGLNVAIIWVIALVLFFHALLFYTAYGNHLLAVGGDAESARARGVRVVRTKWITFVICSTLAALAGILEATKLGFADGSFGRLWELYAIAAAVIGGCLLTGGRGSIIGPVIGAFVLSGIQSQLVIMGAQPQWFMLLLGLIIVLTVLSNSALVRWLRSR